MFVTKGGIVVDESRKHLRRLLPRREKGYATACRKRTTRAIYFKIAQVASAGNETAKGCAEWLRRCIRVDRGFSDAPEMTVAQRFTSRYPACPNLEDQTGLWSLLKPEEIGVQLTEGFKQVAPFEVSRRTFSIDSSGIVSCFEPAPGVCAVDPFRNSIE